MIEWTSTTFFLSYAISEGERYVNPARISLMPGAMRWPRRPAMGRIMLAVPHTRVQRGKTVSQAFE